jgi:hypothetical protein
MLARCGRVLWPGEDRARGFDTLGMLDDAFDLSTSASSARCEKR